MAGTNNPTEEFLVRSARAAHRDARRRRRKWWAIFAILVLAAAGAAWAIGAVGGRDRAAQAKYVWVQMLPDQPALAGGRLARAIVTDSDRCPKLLEDRREVEMTRRPSPLRDAFPVLVCEAPLRPRSDAWIGSRHLPTRPENPRDIVVIGDTGCRMVYWQIQPCRNGVEWPFAAVAVRAADTIQSGGSQSILIHVGDFHYRENPCADRSPACGGSPYGDNWETWEEEFFRPAGPLLLAAPWVIVRGNHENCARAGAGWLFFFALPGSTDNSACQHELDSYSLAIGQAAGGRPRVLVVLDTANADNQYNIKPVCDAFGRWINKIDDSNAVAWLALHQPLLARSPDGTRSDTAADDEVCEQDVTKDALKVIRSRLLSKSPSKKVKVVLSGDHHMVQFFQPTEPERPLQIITGNGGTKLNKVGKLVKDADTRAKPEDAGAAPQWDLDVTSYGVQGSALTVGRHGFVTMHSDGQTWTVTMLGVDGRSFGSCRFSETSPTNRAVAGQLDCDNPAAAR